MSSRVLVDQLLALAQRLSSGAATGRQDVTRRFWLIARQLRAGLPPLVLPSRTGSPRLRVGYLVASPEAWLDRLALIRSEHAEGGEQVSVFLRGDFGTLDPIDWAKVIDLTSLNDIQAARAVAEDDLDVLADVDGGMLRAMPLLIALHPARRLVEAAFVPAVSGGAVGSVDEFRALVDPEAAIRVVRAILDARPVSHHTAEASPAALNARLNRAIQMHQAGEVDAARVAYEEVLAMHPMHPIAAYLLGQLFHRQQQPEPAIAWLQAASIASPDFRDAHYTLAQRLADAGRWHEAVASYRAAVDLTPGFAAGWSGLGLASLRTRDALSRSTISHLERAVALEPESSEWSFNLGTGWQRQGNLEEARSAYLRALQFDPGHIAARFNLGTVAQEIGDIAQAADAYRAVLDREPRFGSAYAQLGACLLQAGQIEAWIENFRRYRASCGESLSMAVYGLEASVAMGDAAAHADWLERVLAGHFPSSDAEDFIRNWEQLLFLLLHVDLDRRVLMQWYRRYDEVAGAWYGAPAASRAARRPGPLRIGYLSGDLRDHVMGRMIFELVSRHDRSRIQPVLYALNSESDSFTARFRELGFPFVELAKQPYASAASRIGDDDLDILIDCSGHTRGAQQGILALKPARVIATHIATPGPVGLRTIDYKLTDEFAESADAQEYLIERLWPVPGGVFPWHRYPEAGVATRDSLGIGSGAFVCGAFVSLMKLSPRCLRIWGRILDRIPNAVLALSPPGSGWQSSYLRWLRAHGIRDQRVVFVPYEKEEPRSLSRYRVLDVALDPMPCGNVNGTMEALAMGVPVLTLVGDRHGERLGNALLRRFGVTDTIAEDEDKYVGLAERIALDSSWVASLRERIRDLAITSPVWDSEARVRDLEASLASMLAERRHPAAP